ncbi:alpha/beta hydrolase [Nocardioides sp.]|uniref:alpha/beta fold hydrolase n=1 Tax=Nocardioides sp. TaxID=35761 RepID=UPI00286DF4E9|nr:alpha/beta hydrolase [Nocardioides sp.]
MISPLDAVRRGVYLPYARLPYGAMLDLPGRGATYVTDTAGPEVDSPAILLLHAIGTTGLLTWYPAIEPLSRHFRVVTMDQRWHGRGIQSEEFSLADCADDAAAVIEALGLRDPLVCGYSMGSIVAQRVWRQHPHAIEGLVLAATTDYFRATPWEKGFHASLGVSMLGLRGLARSRSLTYAARRAATAVDLAPSDIHEWALAEMRRTSPWAVGQALAALGRHHTRPWLSRIDVPTAVVVTRHDRVIPAARQVALARRIPGATVHDIPAGHASCVLQSEIFVPALVEAAVTVAARRGELRR